MIAEIFSKIEERLLAHAVFSGWTFFRSENKANSGPQSRASIPFLRLSWEQESIGSASAIAYESRVALELEARWETAETNVNAIARITGQSAKGAAIKQALFAQAAGEYTPLGLEYVSALEINIRNEKLTSSENKKQLTIFADVEITYTGIINE